MQAAEHYEFGVTLFELVLRVEGSDGNFTVLTKAENGAAGKYHSRKIAVATGYYDLPNKSMCRVRICRMFRITTRSRTRFGRKM